MSKIEENETTGMLDKAFSQGLDENDERFKMLEELFEKMTGKNIRQWLNGEIKFYRKYIDEDSIREFEYFKFRINLCYRNITRLMKGENTLKMVISTIRAMCRELGFNMITTDSKSKNKYCFGISDWNKEKLKKNKCIARRAQQSNLVRRFEPWNMRPSFKKKIEIE